MLDVILIPEGETETVFDLAIGLDREQPMQTALGMVTPVPVVPTTKGPPHVGAAGWLFHLDAANLLLTEPAAAGGRRRRHRPAAAGMQRLQRPGRVPLRSVRRPTPSWWTPAAATC